MVERDYSRTEHDDFVLNVQSKIDDTTSAIPVYGINGNLVGWKLQPRYE